MGDKSLLFTPYQIGGLELKNRMIVTAMHTGFSIDQEAAFLKVRAKGGAAAVTATMGVSNSGAQFNMCVLNEEILPGLTDMANSVHDAGGKLFIQLFHAGRNGNTGFLADSKASPVAPSPIPSPIYRETPKELTADEINDIIKDFGKAAEVCKRAGVDAVEISCSAGYLLSEFLSELSNVRQDKYGGTPENRRRFPLEVIKMVRESVGNEYPVILRVSGSDMLGGYGIEQTVELVKEAEKYIDAVNVTGGWHESKIPQISMHVPEGGFAFLAREVKKAVKTPVIACNRINNRNIAEDILYYGYSDFVGCARAFLIDSEFGNKIKEGKRHRKCIGCNGCIERVLKGENVICTFNPSVGYEANLEQPLPKKSEKVLVVGGGAAGMQAALEYAKLGCKVRLCSNEASLGGLMKYAASIPYKEAINNNILAMEEELAEAGVEIVLNTFVDGNYINEYNPDITIVAVGSKPTIPPIPGIDQKHVYTAQEVLDGDQDLINRLATGNVLIIGGGAVGLETAIYLIKNNRIDIQSKEFLSQYTDSKTYNGLQYASNITIAEMTSKMGSDLKSTRWITMSELKRYNIQLLVDTKVEKILDNKVTVSKADETFDISADFVVLATGYQSEGKELIKWLDENEHKYKIIGDAKKVGTIRSALSDAYSLKLETES
ncbi:MAG: FAD-dependent oxidoreductase [Anaerovoracaceae bacterium]|jgi:2,4-dienoyl-CoA reductase (NADPH2)